MWHLVKDRWPGLMVPVHGLEPFDVPERLDVNIWPGLTPKIGGQRDPLILLLLVAVRCVYSPLFGRVGFRPMA